MSNEVAILAWTAATIGFIHTVFGPDHYLPFIVIAKARKWTTFKTAVITFLCGIGHVLSSVILGFIGLFLGIAVFKLKAIEVARGEIAAWLLLIFGFAYLVWGIHRAIRWKPHSHLHPHKDGEEHLHLHRHTEEHLHIHSREIVNPAPRSQGEDFLQNSTRGGVNLTPWILFTIFVFGPCEPLIPLIMYPAAKHNMVAITAVAFIFAATTISTMLGIVLTSSYGLAKLPMQKLERYSHALAGLAIFLCGAAIKFLGL